MTRSVIRTANMHAALSMRTQLRVSVTAFAVPSLESSITSVRSTPTFVSLKSAFAGCNESYPDTRCAKPTSGDRWSGHSGLASRPPSSRRRSSSPLSDANCAAPSAAVSRSAAACSLYQSCSELQQSAGSAVPALTAMLSPLPYWSVFERCIIPPGCVLGCEVDTMAGIA
jgi:hypothetical protein